MAIAGADVWPVQVSRGEVLAGKYRVEHLLGEGGYGTVVAAKHLALDQTVALKLLKRTAAQNEDVVKRFLREARAVAQMRSDHVARVLDFGTLDSGLPYIAFEFLAGEDLAAMLARTGPLSVSEAVGLVMQACEGLAEAHGLGIVHRDLKPSNLFLTEAVDGSPLVKVLDFGVSKMRSTAVGGTTADLTRSYTILGSPKYMAPEQFATPRTVDQRTDVWALGVILFELLTRSVPFTGASVVELCVSIAEDRPPALTARAAEVPPALSDAVARCLSKKSEHRFGTVVELAAELAPFALRDGPAILRRISAIHARASRPR